MFASGYTKKEILSSLKISDRTLQHWFQKDTFRDTLSQAIGIVFRGVLSKAATFSSEALDILIDISRDKDTPTKYRIQAIQLIFDILLKSGASNTLEDNTVRENQNKVDRIASYVQLREVIDMANQDSDNFSLMPSEDEKADRAKIVWAKLFPDEEFPDDLN